MILPFYARLAAKLTRRDLIIRVGVAFALILVGFWLSQPGLLFGRLPIFGILFYLFVGIFSVTLVAQFWAFSSDLYGPERGTRLFPLIAIGAALGSTVGAWVGERLLRSNALDPFDLILLALVPLSIALGLATWSDRRGTYGAPSTWTTQRWDEPAAPANAQTPASDGPYRLIFQHRYLTLTAVMMMVFTWVLTSGDNILFGIVQSGVAELATSEGLSGEAYSAAISKATAAFYSDLYFWINLITLLLQAFVVSRMLSAGGMRVLLFTTPLISLAAYASIALLPILAVVKVLKVVENSSSLSIHNTARQMLWLPTTKEMLYQAKPTVDTLFVRLGDGLAAATILVGTRIFQFSLLGFVVINIVLVLVWLTISVFLHREHKRWRAAADAPEERFQAPIASSPPT